MQVNIKRMLSFLVVLAMVLSMVPVTGIPAIEAKAETATAATAGTLTLDSENKAKCDHCGETVVWEALTNSAVIGQKTEGKSHYYLAEDSSVYKPFLTFSAAAEVCLHLNGKNLACAGTGGAIVVQSNGKLNILGDGTVKRTTNGALFEIWSCTVNLYGGTYILNTNAYGITDATSDAMFLKGGSPKVTLHNNASLVGTTDYDAGILTLAEGWNGQIGNLEVADTLWSENAIKKANLVVKGNLTGTVVCDQAKMVLVDGQLTKGQTKLTVDEYCQTCGKYVTWTELKNGQRTDGTSDHYYLAEDISTTGMVINGANYKQASAFSTVCLRLNGKTLTTNSTTSNPGAIYGSNATTINIFGEGGTVVNTGAAQLLTTDTSRVNLFGGTYTSTTANATNIRGGNSNVYLYDDAKIEGVTVISAGKAFLNDSASIKGLQLPVGGTLTAEAGWTGSLKNAEGKYIELVDGAWTVVTKTPEWGKFEPEACDGKAYCEHCGKDAGAQTWTALKGNTRIGAVGSGLVSNTHYHFYLSGNLNSSAYTQVLSMSDGVSVCLNLNGYNMANAGRILATGTGFLAIMGEGNVTMDASRTSDTESYREAALVASAKGGVYLYGGTYSVIGNAITEGRPTINVSSSLYIKDAAVVKDIVLVSSGKLVVDAGWTGSATLTLPEGKFANGMVAAANGAATGDFTGTLKLDNGTVLVNRNGALGVEVQTPVWGEFNPEACGGLAYCEACGQEAGPQEWIAKSGADRIDYKGDGNHYHYYLTGELNHPVNIGQVLGLENSSKACLYLNGKTINTGGRMYVGSGCVLNIFGDGNVIFSGDTTQVHTNPSIVYKDALLTIGGTNAVVNILGGTYSLTGQAVTDARPIIKAMGNVTIKNATLNGDIAPQNTTNLKLEGSTSVDNINLTAKTKLTIDANWTGTATVTAAEGIFANGAIAAANGAATGDFTGTLKLSDGTVLVNVDGKLAMDATFNPEAATNYCEQCKKFVAWTALEGDVNIGVVQTEDEVGTDKHEHYYLSGDVNYTGDDAFVFVTRKTGSTNYTGSSVCLKLNGKTLTTKSPLKVGSGSNLYIFGENGTLNYTGTSEWYLGTCEFKLFGGTYNNFKGYCDTASAKLYLSDGATVNGTFRVPVGQLFLSGDSSINKVTLTGTGKINLDASWTGNLVVDATALMVDGMVPAANIAVAGGALNGTIKDTYGNEFIYADGQVGIDMTFNPDAETSYCRVCNTKVAWEALPETLDSKALEVGHHHYYVPEDMTNKDATLFIVGKAGYTFCLNLNSKTLTLTGCLYGSWLATINVIGDGTVVSTGGKTVCGASCNMHLYGGTYIASATGNALECYESGTPKFYLHEDAKLVGNSVIDKGELHLYDQAEIETLNIKGGKTTFHAGWSGSAALNVAEDLVTDGVVNAANAVAVAGITGTLTDVFGSAYTVNGTSLVVPAVTINPNVFEPWNHNGYAYCDCAVCDGKQQLVKWVDFNEFTEKNGIYDGIGNNSLSDPSGVIDIHFYLSDNMTYTTHLLSTYENVCFNFNGYDVTAEKVDTAGHAFSSTQYLVLMNTAEKMATVTGWQTAYAQATALWINGGNASSTTYLCENVTLTTHDGCTADAPVVHLSTNGGKFYLNGGIIDASNRTTAKYPAAVMINGTAKNPGKFYMNSGEIKGGTSTESSGAVQIGGITGDAAYDDGAYFEMNGGTISGGKAAKGGNLVLNKRASEAVINGTITGGEATVSGGNIYVYDANLTIGEKGVVSNGKLVFTDMQTFGVGGGNIYFAAGTLTTSGTITNGEVTKFKGAGGNIFLDGNGGDLSFVMNGGLIANGKLPTGEEEIYGGADFGGQSYGANIRGYKIKEIKLLGGTIEGGQGGNAIKADGRDVYIACHNDVVTEMTIGDVTINGAVQLARHKLTLTGAPKINAVDGENALTVGPNVEVNISGLTEGADIELSNIVANIPLTVACDNAEALKAYFTVIGMDGAVLNVVEGQLIVIGVAIVDGEEATWYATAADAIAAYTAEDYAAGKYIQLGLDAELKLKDGEEYLIDLAGYVAGEVAITGKGAIVHLFDSANVDLDGFRNVTVDPAVELVRDNTVILGEEAYRFITVTAGGKTSAHALTLAVNGVNLRTEKAGLYYNAEYVCDEFLAEMISAYGVILSLKDMPGAVAGNGDVRTVLTEFVSGTQATSSSVFGIFKDTRTAEQNAAYGKMKIYANAYIDLDLDGDGVADTVVADTENVGQQAGTAWSLYDVLKNIDENWDDFADDQEAVKAFYDAWFDKATSAYAEDFKNIDVKVDVEGGEGEGVIPEDTDVDVPTDK